MYSPLRKTCFYIWPFCGPEKRQKVWRWWYFYNWCSLLYVPIFWTFQILIQLYQCKRKFTINSQTKWMDLSSSRTTQLYQCKRRFAIFKQNGWIYLPQGPLNRLADCLGYSFALMNIAEQFTELLHKICHFCSAH